MKGGVLMKTAISIVLGALIIAAAIVYTRPAPPPSAADVDAKLTELRDVIDRLKWHVFIIWGGPLSGAQADDISAIAEGSTGHKWSSLWPQPELPTAEEIAKVVSERARKQAEYHARQEKERQEYKEQREARRAEIGKATQAAIGKIAVQAVDAELGKAMQASKVKRESQQVAE